MAFVTLLVITFVAVIAYPGIIGALEQVIEGIKLGLHYFALGIWIGIHDRELSEKYKNARTKKRRGVLRGTHGTGI